MDVSEEFGQIFAPLLSVIKMFMMILVVMKKL